ncbi:hypothetical protein QO206_14050 [Leeuwenhoekiella aequorea]|uniref:hypothetical protein n=1 Tax=Leeuwenhoekiella aequorea TaxID=283736 RepID=UPI00352EEDDA
MLRIIILFIFLAQISLLIGFTNLVEDAQKIAQLSFVICCLLINIFFVLDRVELFKDQN